MWGRHQPPVRWIKWRFLSKPKQSSQKFNTTLWRLTYSTLTIDRLTIVRPIPGNQTRETKFVAAKQTLFGQFDFSVYQSIVLAEQHFGLNQRTVLGKTSKQKKREHISVGKLLQMCLISVFKVIGLSFLIEELDSRKCLKILLSYAFVWVLLSLFSFVTFKDENKKKQRRSSTIFQQHSEE